MQKGNETNGEEERKAQRRPIWKEGVRWEAQARLPFWGLLLLRRGLLTLLQLMLKWVVVTFRAWALGKKQPLIAEVAPRKTQKREEASETMDRRKESSRTHRRGHRSLRLDSTPTQRCERN